jgi:hypothetical protein
VGPSAETRAELGVVGWAVTVKDGQTSYHGYDAAGDIVVRLEHVEEENPTEIQDRYALQRDGATGLMVLTGIKGAVDKDGKPTFTDSRVDQNTFLTADPAQRPKLRRALELLQHDLDVSAQAPLGAHLSTSTSNFGDLKTADWLVIGAEVWNSSCGSLIQKYDLDKLLNTCTTELADVRAQHPTRCVNCGPKWSWADTTCDFCGRDNFHIQSDATQEWNNCQSKINSCKPLAAARK